MCVFVYSRSRLFWVARGIATLEVFRTGGCHTCRSSPAAADGLIRSTLLKGVAELRSVWDNCVRLVSGLLVGKALAKRKDSLVTSVCVLSSLGIGSGAVRSQAQPQCLGLVNSDSLCTSVNKSTAHLKSPAFESSSATPGSATANCGTWSHKQERKSS